MESSDLDGDGWQDLVALDEEEDVVRLALGRGDGTFDTISALPLSRDPFELMVVDLDGDSRPDLLTASRGSFDLSFFAGRGDGTFDPPDTIAPGPEVTSFAIGDFTGDGFTDLLLQVAGEDSLLMRGDGSLAFQPSRPTRTGYTSSSGLGDLDGDGRADLVTVTGISGYRRLVVLLAQADGTFEFGHRYPIEPGGGALLVSDLDGDGRNDVVATSDVGSYVEVFRGLGDGRLGPPRRYSAGGGGRPKPSRWRTSTTTRSSTSRAPTRVPGMSPYCWGLVTGPWALLDASGSGSALGSCWRRIWTGTVRSTW